MVSGNGNSNPKGIFIIDSPTVEDEKKGYACTGYTRKLLNEFLHEQGLNDSEFYFTAFLKEKIEIPEKKKDYERFCDSLFSNDGFNFAHILKEEINGLQPHLIIPLGELSFNFITNLRGIRKYRGSVLPAHPQGVGTQRNYKALPILGPNPFLNQEYNLRVLTRVDFAKIPKYLNDGPIPDTGLNLWVAENTQTLSKFLTEGYQKWKEGKVPYVVFDIETWFGIPTCIAFSFDGIESCCIPIIDTDIDPYIRAQMLSSVAKFLASDIAKVNQNIKFDLSKLERYRIKVENVVGDTMLAANCIYPELPRNLGLLTSLYTDLPYHKDEGKGDSAYDPSIEHRKKRRYIYCAKDTVTVHQIYSKQLEEMRELGTEYVYGETMKCLPIFRKMESTGIKIDMEKRDALAAKYESKARIQVAIIRSMIGDKDFNPLSPDQCRILVYERLKYKPIRVKIDKFGEETGSTGEEELEMLMVFGEPGIQDKNAGSELLKCIINCRKLDKVRAITALPIYPDGRFRGEWNLAGTKNGRTSTGKCTDEVLQFDAKDNTRIIMKKLGFAMHNLGKHGFSIDGVDYGKDIRTMFIADEGYSMVEIDLSQAEARVDAVLANNTKILEIFDSKVGIHKTTGSWVYGCDPSEIKKNTLVDGVDRYHMSKTIRHAGERNMTPQRLVMMVQRPLKECQEVLITFHKFQPEIRGTFHREVREAINSSRRLVAPNGRARDFFDRVDEHTYNEAISYLPQAIVGDQMKFSFHHVWGPEGFARDYSHLILEAHDGCVALVKEGREKEYVDQFKPILERPINFSQCTLSRDYDLVIPAEAAMGKNWGTINVDLN